MEIRTKNKSDLVFLEVYLCFKRDGELLALRKRAKGSWTSPVIILHINWETRLAIKTTKQTVKLVPLPRSWYASPQYFTVEKK